MDLQKQTCCYGHKLQQSPKMVAVCVLCPVFIDDNENFGDTLALHSWSCERSVPKRLVPLLNQRRCVPQTAPAWLHSHKLHVHNATKFWALKNIWRRLETNKQLANI